MIDMAKIGPSKGTSSERLIGRFLRACGLRVVMNDKRLPGSPDCHLPQLKVAVFADGRFWHDPKFAGIRSKPHHLTNFYAKACANRRRDCRNNRELLALGYRIVRIWDSSLKGSSKLRTLRLLLTVLDRSGRPKVTRI